MEWNPRYREAGRCSGLFQDLPDPLVLPRFARSRCVCWLSRTSAPRSPSSTPRARKGIRSSRRTWSPSIFTEHRGPELGTDLLSLTGLGVFCQMDERLRLGLVEVGLVDEVEELVKSQFRLVVAVVEELQHFPGAQLINIHRRPVGDVGDQESVEVSQPIAKSGRFVASSVTFHVGRHERDSAVLGEAANDVFAAVLQDQYLRSAGDSPCIGVQVSNQGGLDDFVHTAAVGNERVQSVVIHAQRIGNQTTVPGESCNELQVDDSLRSVGYEF